MGYLKRNYTSYVLKVNFIFSLFLIDRYGRKILHLVGLSGMLVMTILLGVLLEQDTSIKVSIKQGSRDPGWALGLDFENSGFWAGPRVNPGFFKNAF